MLTIKCYFGKIYKDCSNRCYAQGYGRLFSSWEKTLDRADAFDFYAWLYTTKFPRDWIPHQDHRRHKNETLLIMSFGSDCPGEEEFFIPGRDFESALREGGLDKLFEEFQRSKSVQ